MRIKVLNLLFVLLVSGCAIVPENIEVTNEDTLVSYSEAVVSSSSANGKPTRWGGAIVGVENKSDHTYIEIVHFPLNNYGKPMRYADTIGRFKVELEGFVDPILFEEGRLITFVGTLDTPMAGMVGEQPYLYPKVVASNYHMWRKEVDYDVNGLYLAYHGGWYSPFFYPYHFRFNPWVGPWGYHIYRPRPFPIRVNNRQYTRPTMSGSRPSNRSPSPSRTQTRTHAERRVTPQDN